MKLLWNSLLISLGILLPTSIVLAQPPKTSESADVAASPSELVSIPGSSAAPRSDVQITPQDLSETLHPQKTLVSANPATPETISPTPHPQAVAVPIAVETRPFGTSAPVPPQESRLLAKVEFTPFSPPLLSGETNSLPLIRGGLGWGALYFCKRSSVKTIVVPNSVPVATPSTPIAKGTNAPEKIPSIIVPSSKDAVIGVQIPVQTNAPDQPTTTVLTVKDSTTEKQAPARTNAPDKAPTTTVPTTKNPPPEVQVPTRTNTPDKAPSSESSPSSTQAPPQTNTPDKTPTTKKPSSENSADAKEPKLSPEEIARQQKLIEADQLYMSGQIAAAQKLYRQAKDPFKAEVPAKEKAPAIYDVAKLSPAGAVYWRMSEEGLAQKLETKIMVPLQFLVEQYPEFIPGHLRYAQALKANGKPEEALHVLERASTLYPAEPDLLKAEITALSEQEKWLEASLAARQFALLYPNNPQSKEFAALADENLEHYKRYVRRKLRGNAIANAITGAVGFVLTGNLFGPISTVESTVMLLRGESAVGKSVANQVKRRLPMMEDEQVLNYVREVGNKLAAVAGRNDFQYEFNVIMDDELNAFALPGGKVFVNAGAILKTNSEAELAGLLGHELSHAVLSHGFQLATQGNLTANVTQFFPYGGVLGDLLILNYSRDMERQADALGTRLLASSGYPADGMRNLMVTLDKQERDRTIFTWLSDHPNTKERVHNLETLIESNGYNRYTYEGVARHLEIQKRVRELMRQYKERKERKEHKDE